MKTESDQIRPYVTKDSSEIRELLHPSVHGNRAQSLAEARLAPGVATTLHCHGSSDMTRMRAGTARLRTGRRGVPPRAFDILAGHGVMTLGNQRFPVKPGDSVCIAPGTPHCLHNIGAETLVLLCCCAPPCAHGDTEQLT